MPQASAVAKEVSSLPAPSLAETQFQMTEEEERELAELLDSD